MAQGVTFVAPTDFIWRENDFSTNHLLVVERGSGSLHELLVTGGGKDAGVFVSGLRDPRQIAYLPGAIAVVPEPSSLSIFAVGGVTASRCRFAHRRARFVRGSPI